MLRLVVFQFLWRQFTLFDRKDFTDRGILSASHSYQRVKLLWFGTLFIVEDRVEGVENLDLCKQKGVIGADTTWCNFRPISEPSRFQN
ncbi:MAG: hypothetical protein BA861_05540 [Desulfobacterales bacterium S3730MH5]|nr:MAG: hypothetical protein BA861_05540 [Desulfobacterales bacterium S3730MH5]